MLLCKKDRLCYCLPIAIQSPRSRLLGSLISTPCRNDLARALRSGHDIYMEEHLQHLFFEEEQRFPLWIRAIVLLGVVAFAFPAILMWSFVGDNLGTLRI